MSTDIHICVEVRETGHWRAEVRPNPWYGRAHDEPEELLAGWLWDDQDYDLFAILADVRNRIGFAGTDRGDPIVPIAQPRGLPDDVSDRVGEESEQLGDGVHSRSWLTLRELLEYDWDQAIACRGWVSEHGYEEYLRTGWPGSFCGAVMGEDVERVTNDEMRAIVAEKMRKAPAKRYFTRLQWTRTPRELAGHFLDDVVPVLEQLGGPDDVRLVFWFDN